MYHKPIDTQRCLPYSTSHPKHWLKNIPFVLATRICTIVENNSLKNKYLRELKKNYRTYGYPEKVVEIGIQKALKIPQTELRQPKTIENNNNLTFITTFNPNNPKIFDLVKSGVNVPVENNVNGFKNIRLIYVKRQPPNLKRIITNSLFTNQTAGAFKCSDSRYPCCRQLLLEISYTFKNVGKQFFLKTKMTCDNKNLVYVVICPTCKEEYISETGIGDSKLRDKVRIYRQHIQQPEHGSFIIFPFLQLRSNDTDLRREYEDYFIKKYKTKLNSL